MNLKRKNKHGFTLVELVVVMCIFGMILSCILNFMKPANEVHEDVQATMDANIISSGIIEYLDDELRYANNVLVLQDYLGVPAVSDKGYVGEYNIPFTNCIMIDNVHFRVQRVFGQVAHALSHDDELLPVRRCPGENAVKRIDFFSNLRQTVALVHIYLHGVGRVIVQRHGQ